MVQIPNSKILEICPPDFHVSRAWKWKGAGANNFPPFLGMYLTPPATQNIKKYFWGGPRIFKKWDPKMPIFRILNSETRFGTSFPSFKMRWYFSGKKKAANKSDFPHMVHFFSGWAW